MSYIILFSLLFTFSEVVYAAPAIPRISTAVAKELQDNADMKTCYQQSDSFRDKKSGSIVIYLDLDHRGAITGVKPIPAKSTLKDLKLSDCAIQVIDSVQLPLASKHWGKQNSLVLDFKMPVEKKAKKSKKK